MEPESGATLNSQELSLREESNLDKLLKRGGFPEPLFAATETAADRWREQYVDGLIRTDILDFEKINDFKTVKLLLELLRKRVGSPISYASLAQDLEVSPTTIKKYIQIFEGLYIIFRVTPYSKNIARSILKEPKIYFFDTGLVDAPDEIKFENCVATYLMKHTLVCRDLTGKHVDLYYLRTKEGKEVDFCLVNEKGLDSFIEVKWSDDSISRNLRYFTERYADEGARGVQVLRYLKTPYWEESGSAKIFVERATSYLKTLLT